MKLTATQKRYIASSFITFVSTFLLVLATELQDFNFDSIEKGAVLGICLVAGRAALKAVVEYSSGLLNKK